MVFDIDPSLVLGWWWWWEWELSWWNLTICSQMNLLETEMKLQTVQGAIESDCVESVDDFDSLPLHICCRLSDGKDRLQYDIDKEYPSNREQ